MHEKRATDLRSIAWPLLLFSAIAFPARSQAATWRLIAVAQPLRSEAQIEIRDVVYSIDTFSPGAELTLTCEPNTIRNIGEDFEEETADRNVASKFGVSLDVGPVWNGRAAFDTLAVTLDASRVVRSAPAGLPDFPDAIVEATVLCIRINAARSEIMSKYLNLRVLGPARFQHLGRVYPVEPLVGPLRTFDVGRGVIPEPQPRGR